MVFAPIGDHRLGFSYGLTGNTILSESALSFIHVLPLTSNVFITTDAGWFRFDIAGYENVSDYSISEGIYFLRNNFYGGLRFINIVSGGDAQSSRGTGRSVNYGLGYRLSERVKTHFAVLSESGYPTTWALGTNLKVHSNFSFLIEAGEKPSGYSFGAEFQSSGYRFTYHLKQHQDLGSTSQLGISYLLAR